MFAQSKNSLAEKSGASKIRLGVGGLKILETLQKKILFYVGLKISGWGYAKSRMLKILDSHRGKLINYTCMHKRSDSTVSAL